MTDPPVVTIDTGRVRGAWRGASAAFLGIPFAEPPIGQRRFAAPVPVAPWEGVRDAVTFGATPQRWVSPEPTLIPEPSVEGPSTLNVNVFTPSPRSATPGLPVLVWIHGGGYVSGSPASPWYDGRAFNRDGVVTVSVSYRLGFDGFGWIEGAPSNRGVRDLLLALGWVQRNIAAFGGDPARVTIAGQSAGGGAVLTLLGMPAAQHLFHAAWSMSGALADVPEARAREIATRLGEILDVEPTLEGFRGVPEKRIEHDQMPATRRGEKGLAAVVALLGDAVSYGPVIDGDLLIRPTVESLRAGVGGDKPLVIGSVDDEFAMVVTPFAGRLRVVPARLALGVLGLSGARRRGYLDANRLVRRRGTAAVLGRYVSDRIFRRRVPQVADARAEASAPTWAYRFAWVSPARGLALHCLDVPFFFDCLDAERVGALAGENPPPALAAAVHGAAVAFVREGRPGWPAWSDAPANASSDTPSDTSSDAGGTTRVFDVGAARPAVIRDGYAEVAALNAPRATGAV